jgi:flap endonuclease-1
VHPEVIQLQPGLKALGITQEQLVDIAILIGTDFNDGVRGFGPKKSLQLIKKTGSLEKAMETISELRQNLPSQEIETIRRIFLKPDVTEGYVMQWSAPDPSRVLRIMCDEHQFSRERIEPILEKFSSLTHLGKQRNLFDFSR